jgi:hypothetical protein
MLKLPVSLPLIVQVSLPFNLLVGVLSVQVRNDLVRELAEALFDPAQHHLMELFMLIFPTKESFTLQSLQEPLS